MRNNINAQEVIKDLSQKLADREVENSILFVGKQQLSKEIENLKIDIKKLQKRGWVIGEYLY